MNSSVDVSVIIVSYNTRDMTLKCLKTLGEELANLASRGVSFEVWVVDNASTDGSAAAIAQEFAGVNILVSPENIGFGRANNLALKEAQGAFFLLLNSDAFVRRGAIATLLERAKSLPQAAVVAPRLLNRDGSLQRSCWKFPSPGRAWIENAGICTLVSHHHRLGDYSRWAHDHEREVEFVIGACMLVRRGAYEMVGGFDPLFFMYAEETDWQKRMHEAGWKIYFTPEAEVEHWGGASAGADSEHFNDQLFRSLDLYQLKHHGRQGLVSLRLAMICGNSLRFLLWFAKMTVSRDKTQAKSKLRLTLRLLHRQMFRWRLGEAQ